MQKEIERNEKLRKDILNARYVNKHFRTTANSIRDYERLKVRITKIGIKMDIVTAYLENMFGQHATSIILLSQAAIIEENLSIEVDRLAKRNRQALLCWFAENWEIILPFLNQTKEKKKLKLSQVRSSPEIDISDLSQLLNMH